MYTYYQVNEHLFILNHFQVVWITGSAARHAEQVPAEEVLRVCSAKLKKFIRNEFDYKEPTDIIRSTWYSNPYTRGSYSFRSIKSKEMNVWASDLAQPLYDSTGAPRIFFAGEATHGILPAFFRN